MSAIYIHIPFCKTRCTYCDFHSGTNFSLKKEYIEALKKEISLRKNYLKNQCIKTIYFGGGTPSLLEFEDLKSIFEVLNQNFDLKNCEEITLECNPDDLSEHYIQQLKNLPINRLSIGIQSFNNNELKFINRRHSAKQAEEAVKCCQQNGFSNISIDLIFGLPFQTPESFEYNLDKALELNIQHISVYGLTFENGTKIELQRQRKLFNEIDEETSILMYQTAIKKLTYNGFEHYEISNFAKPGRRSKHNSSYWNGTHYLGLGSGAHSFNGTSRQWNVCNTKHYISLCNYFEIEHLSQEDIYNELVITNLRKKEGISLDLISKKFGDNIYNHCKKTAQYFLENQLLEEKNNHLKLTQKGILLSDSIIQDLMI